MEYKLQLALPRMETARRCWSKTIGPGSLAVARGRQRVLEGFLQVVASIDNFWLTVVQLPDEARS
jgi:hypothetical protein